MTLALTLTPVTAFAAPQGRICAAGWYFDSLANAGTNFIGYSPVLSQHNPYKHTIQATFQHAVAISKTFTSSNTTGVSLNFEFVQVKDDVNFGIQYSITGTYTQGTTINVSPGQTVYGQYGLVRQIATGHLYYFQSNCVVAHDQGRITTYSPWTVTWHLW
jgi:hypothetical protein